MQSKRNKERVSKETEKGHFGPYNLKETKKEREQGSLSVVFEILLLLLLLYTLRNNRERETVYSPLACVLEL
jgi:uncharacterized integral membrane protein